MSALHHVIGLGEILWDEFPDRRTLGGAPANVAYHATVLGDRGAVLTSVGQDTLGDQAVALLQQRGVDVTAVQRNPALPTGVTRVAVDKGNVEFTIEANAAWAVPQWTDAWAERVAAADAVCFGTLLCAQKAGRKVVERAAETASGHALRLLDLNLRPPFDTDEAIDCALACANLVKLSEDEALRLAVRFGASGLDGIAAWLLGKPGMRAVAVTCGAAGSLLYTENGCDRQAGIPIAPGPGADPVGAGDGFTAALAHHLVRGHVPARANAAANRYGAFMASCAGAMPAVPDDVIRDITA